MSTANRPDTLDQLCELHTTLTDVMLTIHRVLPQLEAAPAEVVYAMGRAWATVWQRSRQSKNGSACLTDTAVDTLARTTWAEARSDGIAGMQAVCNVVMNRATHPGWWGRNPAGCCTAPYQFSCWNIGDPNRAKLLAVTTADPLFACGLALAQLALDGQLPDITRGADSYYATSIAAPYWCRNLPVLAVIGHQRFYRVRP